MTVELCESEASPLAGLSAVVPLFGVGALSRAAATEDSRYAIAGVRVWCSGGKLVYMATNGHLLVIVDDVEYTGDRFPDFDLIIPREVASRVKAPKRGQLPAALVINDGKCSVRLSDGASIVFAPTGKRFLPCYGRDFESLCNRVADIPPAERIGVNLGRLGIFGAVAKVFHPRCEPIIIWSHQRASCAIRIDVETNKAKAIYGLLMPVSIQ